MGQRRHDIDNLRTFCILLLVPYHAAMAFNCWGEANYVWFLLYLFLISMLALVVSKLQEKFLKQVHWNTPSVWKVWLFGLLPVIGKPVLDIGGKSIGAYLMFFLIGYYVFYREDVTGFLKKYFPLHLVIFLIADLFNVYLFCYCKDLHAVMNTVCMFAAQWFGILTVVGFFAKFLNFSNERTAFLCKNSFAFYILHFVFLVAAQFCFSRYTSSTVLLFLVPCVVAYLVTFLCCVLFSRMKKRVLSGAGKRDGVRK